MEYPYFKGLEADRYSFYRVPKALVKADLFQKMSGDAKLLYAVLLDRMSLSIKNGWQDKHGNAYIICTIEEVMDSIHCARQKAVKLLDELEHEFRLIERRRQGLCKPNLLYVKDLYAGLSQSNYWKYENHTSGGLKNELPGVPKSNGSNTEKINKTDNSEPDLIYPAELQEEERYRHYFKEKLELSIMEQNYPMDKAVLHEILELLVETVTSRKKFLRICGEEKPREVVKSRLMKLDSSHIQYILECLKENSTQIQPIREWLQVAVEESEGESAEKAAELITRLDALVKEQKLLSGSEKQFGIYQITARDQEHDYRFMNLDFVKRHGMEVNRADYELVYTAPLTEKDTLEAIYERFNIQRPADFTGHSLSVSDVVVLNDGKSIKACYVDSIGFAELPDFFKERKMDLKKETILDEQLQEIEIFDKPGLFSNSRLRDEDVPEGLYRYDLRGSDYDPGQPVTVEKNVVVNHAASVLMAEELDVGVAGRLELGEEGMNFTGVELTVREFMEEQQQKRSGLIHGDSYHIAVEGHIGTWYAIDETEIGGEKFFLLEHEEHVDIAACVAVNEQGKLVAEDLWNGSDEDFQEAVQKYLSEKWNVPKKEDVVSEIIEKAAPVPDNSAQDYSDVPVYYEPYELVVNDKVQRENINSINYFRDDKLVQQAISDMEKLMAARQQSKEQERSNTKKSVLDALRSLKAKKQEQPAQEQDKPKKVKTKGMEL